MGKNNKKVITYCLYTTNSRFYLQKGSVITKSGAQMEDIEVLRTMVKSFRLIELRNLMLFAGLSKLGRKIELLARALELIQNADEKIVAKIRELSGEMYKGPVGLT